ncbi:MAG: hypothetical protein KF747_04545 [Nitrospira sp.]|nr:hypothetical protein [Nitrospira sp.]
MAEQSRSTMTDTCACFKSMGQGRNGAFGRAKRIRKSRCVDVEQNTNSVMGESAEIASRVRDALRGSRYRHHAHHTFPSDNNGAAQDAVINYSLVC